MKSKKNKLSRIYELYNQKGFDAVAQAGKKKYQSVRSNLVVSWVRFEYVRKIVGKYMIPNAPPILVLSLPRSGSSWVGITLGKAKNAMYLREPVTTSHMAVGGKAVIDFDLQNPPEAYKIAGDNAFQGIPLFPSNVVIMPDQFSVFDRKQRHVVIKEVNPYACAWYIHCYQPRVLFLVRHPAGVAQSFRRLDWWPDTNENQFYRRQGNHQGAALSAAYSCLKSYQDNKIIFYEDLCERPLEIFGEMFEFAGLNLDAQLEQYIMSSTTNGDRSIHWNTNRDSKKMIDIWGNDISSRGLSDLYSAYHQYDLPWYQSPDDW